MRILQINKFFYRAGGADVHFLDLGRLLESRGHEVIYFSAADSRNEPSSYQKYFVSGIEMRGRHGLLDGLKVAGRVLYSPEAARKIDFLIRETRPEIAHLHNIYHHLSPSILPVLKKHKIPVVMTLHDYKLICPNYRLFTQGAVCERCKKHKYYQAIFHRCIFNRVAPSALAALEMSLHKIWGVYEKNVDVFISPSRFLKEKMVEWGIGARIEVLPNPVTYNLEPACLADRRVTCDPNVILSEAKDLKHSIVDPSLHFVPLRMTSRADKPYLLYFGRLAEEKGLLTLIQAMRKLPEIKLRVVGDGPLAMWQCNNVNIVGYKSGEELLEEIAGARAVVVPSEWYENYPLSVLEAMSYGKPVIASRIGGLPEIVREGESGLLFSPGNSTELAEKIQWLWSNPEAIKKMGQAAQKQVGGENSPEGYYRKLIQVYKELIP